MVMLKLNEANIFTINNPPLNQYETYKTNYFFKLEPLRIGG